MNKRKHKFSTPGILFTIAIGMIHLANKAIMASSSFYNIHPISNNYNFYKWKFGKIFYTKQGTGRPLLLIHDLQTGLSSYEWNKITADLAKTHEVYTLDLLGCGKSEKPKITYTNFLYVQLLCDFVKNVIGRKTDLITSGYSGSFGIMACRNDGDLFRKILLINPPDFKELNKIPNKNSALQKILLETPVIGTMIYNILMCHQNIDHVFSEEMFFNPFQIDAKFLDAYYENAHTDHCKGKYLYASRIGKYTNLNIAHCIHKTDRSIYIIEGTYEKEGKEIVEAYTHSNPAIETTFIKHAKHFPHLENPEEFLAQADIFLN